VAALAILGTSSWAGKSLLTAGLCRWFARSGVRVAPFKAQNMSNNARVAAGGEIGSAQYLQALACGIAPEARFNPVLVKPEADDRSQVVVDGRIDPDVTALDWRERAPRLREAVDAALESLLADFELVLIEGAGSPAEINLADADLANLHAPRLAGANAVLVTDIARGGALAHLYGTWALVDEQTRGRIGGFVFNRFRGDAALLAAAPLNLERMTGVPTLGVLPELQHGLPDEDGVEPRAGTSGGARLAIVAYPTASNLDEFRLLEQVADVVWARRPADIADAELVVLPGSKEPVGDLAWLRATGLAQAVTDAAGAGRRVLGVCGGLQLLGQTVGTEAGLGLLPLATTFAAEKATRVREAEFGPLPAPWQSLGGRRFTGYEIRQGRTSPAGACETAMPGGLGYVDRNVLGVYLHGMFEDPDILEALVAARPARSLDDAFDHLADALDRHVDTRRIRALAGIGPTRERPAPAEPPATARAAAPRSLVLVNTGDGKGKSTAAFGVLLRAAARRGWRACVVQFIKSGRWKVGEEETARSLGVDWIKGGDGFSWESRDLVASEDRAKDAWRLASAAIASDEYRLVVLDEITYPINWGWIDGAEVAAAIKGRPERVNVIATGRDAPPGLLAVADTVTEMVKVRHAYDRGIKARRGLDF
jgi:adenosylcobyric acid synthase